MKYYCLGIKGTGMSTLAQILHDLGNTVSGYDDAKGYKFTEEGLSKRNIKIYYDNDHDIDKDTIVTYSVALGEDHKELVRAKNMGLKVKKYNEILGEITEMFDSICISGTHGKTTTSSLIKHILSKSLGCNYFIGAGDGSASIENNIFVIESDEFNKHFLAYLPTTSIITNIEEEHMECYKDLDDIIETFRAFASKTKKNIIACGDNKNVRRLNLPNMVYYGFNSDNDYIIKNEKITNTGSEFDLYKEDNLVGHFKVNLYGKHFLLDTSAAIITAIDYGISVDEINERLATFKNAKRRFAEEKVGDIIIIDDYAHHPTEIMATIDGIRTKYQDKRLVVVFKPNTYSRTRDFKDKFVEVLTKADKVYLTDIDSNREKQEDYPGVTSNIIVDEIPGAEIIDVNTISKLKEEKDSIICFMSCAYVDDLIKALKKSLES